MFETLPTFDGNHVQRGMVYEVPFFCQKHLRPLCRKFYDSIAEKPGLHSCPYGFNAFVQKVGTTYVTYTTLRVDGHFERKNLNPKIKDDRHIFTPVSEVELQYQIDKSVAISNRMMITDADITNLREQVDELRAIVGDNRKFSSDTLHEVRKLNTALKKQMEESLYDISYFSPDLLDHLKFRIHNAYSTSSLISIRLDAFDLLDNPGLSNHKSEFAVYKCFDKIARCLDVFQKQKRVSIRFSGQSFSAINAFDYFEILPYLIFDNAIKYSPENSEIQATFFEEDDTLHVTVVNTGPLVLEQETERILEKDFRGENAEKLGQNGNGIGLFLAKNICNAHSIEISAIPGKVAERIVLGIPHAPFQIYLRIPLEKERSNIQFNLTAPFGT